jgi:hypothetical protein
MNEVGMEVKIQANVQEAIKGLEHLGQEFVDLQKDGTTSVNTISGAMSALKEAVNKATDTGSIAKYNKALEALAGESVRIKSIGLETPLKKTASASDQAAFALTNLGRVAQDAPFGFIGIQNNLNPLLESFQRLKASTGTTGGALKALGQSLIGPAGLGFALSIVSSLLLVFGDKLFATKKKADEAKDSFDGFLDSTAKEALKLRESFTAIADANIPLENRKKIIKDLRGEYGVYLKNISDETLLTGKATDAYNQINESLLRKLQLQVGEEKILPLLKAQFDLRFQLVDLEKKALDLRTIINGTEGQKTARLQAENTLAIRDSNKNLADQSTIQKQIAGNQQKINDLLKLGVDPFLKFGNNATQGIDTKTAKDIKEKFVRTFQALDAGSIINLPVNVVFKQPEGFGANLQDLFKGQDLNIKEAGLFPGIQKEIQTTADLLNSTLAPAFDAVFNAIEDGSNVFKAVEDSIKHMVLQLVKAAIESAILAVVLNLIAPGLGGAAGGFAGIFGKLTGLGNLFPHADGGIITKPLVAGQHLFGEAGKEAVIPLDRINEFLRPSSQNDGLVMTHAIRGDDLLLILNRANRSAGRNK